MTQPVWTKQKVGDERKGDRFWPLRIDQKEGETHQLVPLKKICLAPKRVKQKARFRVDRRFRDVQWGSQHQKNVTPTMSQTPCPLSKQLCPGFHEASHKKRDPLPRSLKQKSPIEDPQKKIPLGFGSILRSGSEPDLKHSPSELAQTSGRPAKSANIAQQVRPETAKGSEQMANVVSLFKGSLPSPSRIEGPPSDEGLVKEDAPNQLLTDSCYGRL